MPDQSTNPVPFTRWQLLLKQAFRYLPWKRRREGSIKEHAGPIIDLFASIVMRDEQMSETDADVALDFLRYSFPEIEHAWLSRHFKRATQAIHPVSQVAVIAGTNREMPERMSMALEVLALLKNARDQRAIDTLFDEVTVGLMLPGAAPLLRSMVEDTSAPAPEPVTSISFSTSDSADVRLSEADSGSAFRIFHCGEMMLVMNDGEIPLRIRGRSLPPQSLIPLSTGQVITLESGNISFAELSFFVNAKKTGQKLNFYLFLEEGTLVMQRNRMRMSILKITFGMSLVVELLKEADVLLDNVPLRVGQPVSATYQSGLVINKMGPFLISKLQTRTEDIGRRFEVDPGQRILRVSNDPSMIGPGDLLLSQGFSGTVLFEVSFSDTAKTGLLIPLESPEPLVVNGRQVRGPTPLRDGDLIRINFNQSLRCRFEAGVLDEERNIIRELKVDGLSHEFTNGYRVLDNIDFSVRRGEMVCILGPSGSGKSTLLSCLAGHLKPTYGNIRYNGLSLYNWQQKLTPLIAHIPKEDILNPYLTVEEHLSHAMTIRRSKLSSSDRRRRINSLLKYLGLTHLAGRRVGASTDKHLSDGERTRLNLGLDMSGLADVFLVDEPISGLSSRDSENVIDTLENISREKIVIATLHRPSSHLLNRFQKVILLDYGGQIAFWGTPAHMLRYFKEAADELGIAVSMDNKSIGGADYVFEVLEAPLLRHDKGSQYPGLWQERFENYRFRTTGNNELGAFTRSEANTNVPDLSERGLVEYWRLFRVWFMRTLVPRVRSRINLYTALVEGPLLAFLVAFPLRATLEEGSYLFSKALHINSYLFLSAVAAMFFGLMSGSTEIIRDKNLLRRERNARIFFSGYMGSKALVLTLVTAAQCALYLLVGNAILEIHELFMPFFITMVLTSFVGVGLSLFVSLIIKTERAALNVVPLLLVPQILMAGAVVPFNEMNHFISLPPRHEESDGKLKPGRVPYVSELCPLRYSYETLMVLQATRNPYDYNRRLLQKQAEEWKNTGEELSDEQIRHLRLILQSLTNIASLDAVHASDAEYALRRIREAALRNDPDYLQEFTDRFQTRAGEQETHLLSDYFVNERVGGQFDYAEALRLSREMEDRSGIFLAARKPIPFTRNNTDRDDPIYTADKNTIPTPLSNNTVLITMALSVLLISRLVLKKKMERN